jgi:hypothetical protein
VGGCAILSMMAAGALGLTRAPASVSPDGGEVIAQGCQFCYTSGPFTVCSTIGDCASNQVCSGNGGVKDGIPWAQAVCITL